MVSEYPLAALLPATGPDGNARRVALAAAARRLERADPATLVSYTSW